MNRHRTPVLTAIAAIAAVGTLVAAALLMIPARATHPTPAPQVTTTILAKWLFDAIRVNTHAYIPTAGRRS